MFHICIKSLTFLIMLCESTNVPLKVINVSQLSYVTECKLFGLSHTTVSYHTKSAHFGQY